MIFAKIDDLLNLGSTPKSAQKRVEENRVVFKTPLVSEKAFFILGGLNYK